MKTCSNGYLVPNDLKNLQCQLICSNGEYYSDGICVSGCDKFEYPGRHRYCHGCLDKGYDNGVCMGTDGRCEDIAYYEVIKSPYLQR